MIRTPAAAASPPANVRHILILKPSSLGDIVHTLPAVAAVRKQFPSARITWMVNPEWAPLLEGNPDINDTLIFPRADFRGPLGTVRFLRWRKKLPRKLHPDLIIDFQGLLRTGLVAHAFRGVPAYGLSDAREGARFFQTTTVRVDGRMHSVERYLALAAAVGAAQDGPPEFHLPGGIPPATALPREPWILLHPFSRGQGKSLSPDAIAAFCHEMGMPVLLAGRSSTACEIPPNAINLLNQTTLHELLWLLRHAAFTVSVDSGPMHLAAAVTDKLLGIHAWSDPRLVGPYRPGAHVWKGGKIFSALDSASSSAGEHLPTPDEAAGIARWVRSRVLPG